MGQLIVLRPVAAFGCAGGVRPCQPQPSAPAANCSNPVSFMGYDEVRVDAVQSCCDTSIVSIRKFTSQCDEVNCEFKVKE